MSNPHEKERRFDLDRAKGLGILLVVIGHLVAREPPIGNNWYVLLKQLIYTFHMPFFVFITGLIAALTWKPVTDAVSYRSYVAKKFERLMPAYFLLAFAIFGLKLVAQSRFHVDNPIGSPREFFKIVTNPRDSFSAFLWYAYLMFSYYLVLPIAAPMFDTARGGLTCVLASVCVSALALRFPFPGWFGGDAFCEYLAFFVVGFASGRDEKSYLSALGQRAWIYGVGFLLLVAMRAIGGWYVPKLLIGLVACPALHGFVRCRWFERDQWLVKLGQFAFPIYLFNTLAIGGTKAVLLHLVDWNGAAFPFVAIVLLTAGLFGPIVVRQVAGRWTPRLARWIA